MAAERRKSWHSDDEEDDDDDLPSRGTTPTPGKPGGAAPLVKASSLIGGRADDEILKSGDQNATLLEYIDKVEPLVMSINTLYNQYVAGLEHRPPLEKRAQLEHVMKILNALPKVTPGYRFKFKNALDLYTTYKGRWEKLMQDIESGKVKRVIKKGRAA